MDANQLAEALARAVDAAKPAAEYCFLFNQDRWWTVCMTKAEWSGWMQAIGAVFAICAALSVAFWQLSAQRKDQLVLARALIQPFSGALLALPMKLPTNGSRSLWDVQLTRELLEGEMRRIDAVPLHVLNSQQHLGLFALRLGTLQVIAALKVAETAVVESNQGAACIAEDAYQFLQIWIANCTKATEEGLKLIGNWSRPES